MHSASRRLKCIQAAEIDTPAIHRRTRRKDSAVNERSVKNYDAAAVNWKSAYMYPLYVVQAIYSWGASLLIKRHKKVLCVRMKKKRRNRMTRSERKKKEKNSTDGHCIHKTACHHALLRIYLVLPFLEDDLSHWSDNLCLFQLASSRGTLISVIYGTRLVSQRAP